MPTPREICSDCGGGALEIRIIDKAHHNSQDKLEYTAADAKSGFWSGYPIEGRIAATMCQACGRISLFGVPKE